MELSNSAFDRIEKRLDVANRGDLICLASKKIGTMDNNYIHLMHYAYRERMPNRTQIQAAINRDHGQLVVIDPTQVRIGSHSLTVKVYSQYGLKEIAGPTQYIGGMKAAIEEEPKDFLVETGDIVRFFKGMTTQGQIIGFNGPCFSIRVGEAVVDVSGDDVIDVAKAPKFFPVDQAARDYYLKVFPPAFTNLLTNNDPAKIENKPTK